MSKPSAIDRSAASHGFQKSVAIFPFRDRDLAAERSRRVSHRHGFVVIKEREKHVRAAIRKAKSS
jgi:hypothetical protein